MMKPTPQKPVRVVTGTVHLFTCPVCEEAVTGTVEVEAHLGDLDLSYLPPAVVQTDDAVRLTAHLPVATRARNLTVRHDCAPRAVAAMDDSPRALLDDDDGDHRDRRLAEEEG